MEALQANGFLSLSLVAMKMQQLGYDAGTTVFTGTSLQRQRKRTKKYWDETRISNQPNGFRRAKTQEESLLQTLKELDQFETEFEELGTSARFRSGESN